MHRSIGIFLATGLVIAGCGSSAKAPAAAPVTTAAKAAAATTAAAAPVTTAAAPVTTAAAPVTTAKPAAPVTTAAAPVTTAAAAAGGSIAVTEKEFSFAFATPLKAGANELAITNAGKFPHEVKIIKADSFDALAKTSANVDEAALGAALVAKSDKVPGGGTAKLSVTLAPGKYVVICNVGSGASNHALKGMHVDMTVA